MPGATSVLTRARSQRPLLYCTVWPFFSLPAPGVARPTPPPASHPARAHPGRALAALVSSIPLYRTTVNHITVTHTPHPSDLNQSGRQTHTDRQHTPVTQTRQHTSRDPGYLHTTCSQGHVRVMHHPRTGLAGSCKVSKSCSALCIEVPCSHTVQMRHQQRCDLCNQAAAPYFFPNFFFSLPAAKTAFTAADMPVLPPIIAITS